MRLILLGAPGAGKGSQAVLLAEKLHIPHISTGDIFRENIKNNTGLGRKAREYMDRGALVPDELTVSIVEARLAHPDCSGGFVLDGYPRNIRQAECLEGFLQERGLAVDFVINLHASDEAIVRRLSGRRVCAECGATYHMRNNPPAVEGICDQCGASLVQRDDDREETVKERLKTYHAQTEPLLEYYRGKGKLLTIDGEMSIEETTRALFEVLGVE